MCLVIFTYFIAETSCDIPLDARVAIVRAKVLDIAEEN